LKNVNPRESAGPLRKGNKPVQKKLAIDYVPPESPKISYRRKNLEYHAIQRQLAGGGGRYSRFDRSRSNSLNKKTILEKELAAIKKFSSPNSMKIRSTYRRSKNSKDLS
jgi:hypothetical protein